jgi:hypothetical protein
MNFLGILNFNAPYLPWVLMGFTVLINNIWPWGDLLGLAVGHLYYFLEDVYPRLPASGGRRILRAPDFLRDLFEARDRHNAALPPPFDQFDQANQQPNDGPLRRRNLPLPQE